MESTPSVEGLKDLAHRLRSSIGNNRPADFTPPSSGGDRPGSRSQSRSRALRDARESSGLPSSSRSNPQGSYAESHNVRTQSGVSFASSGGTSSVYELDGREEKPNRVDDRRLGNDDSGSNYSQGSSKRNTPSNLTSLGGNENSAITKPSPLFSNRSRAQNDSTQSRMVSPIQEESPVTRIRTINLSMEQSRITTSDSRNNSTSEDGRHHSHPHVSSWKSSTITTPETLPSPTSPSSPGPPPYHYDDVARLSNVSKVRETPAKSQPREPKQERGRNHDSIEAISPHTQARGKPQSQSVDNFGPPPAPPPVCRLPETPRTVRVSLFPTPARRELNRDIVSSMISNGTSTSGDSINKSHSSKPDVPRRSASRGQHQRSILADNGLLSNKFNTYDPNYPTVEDTRPRKLPMERLDGSRHISFSTTMPPPPRPLSRPSSATQESAITHVVDSHFFGDEQTSSDLPPIKRLSVSAESDISRPASRLSFAPTTSSDGTFAQQRWFCLTRTIEQIPGPAGPPVDYIRSTSLSMQPVDNLPSESNKYWTLCKNAVLMQTGIGKKSPEEVANRPTGLTGNEKYMRCRKCKYEYPAYATTPSGKGATTYPRWRHGPNGLFYKETVLFKSHIPTKKDKLTLEEQHFGCIFCASNGNGMPIFKGKTSFLTHLSEHGNGGYPNDVLKTRIKFMTRTEYEVNSRVEHFELVLP